jgi:hypothetical protein
LAHGAIPVGLGHVQLDADMLLPFFQHPAVGVLYASPIRIAFSRRVPL